MALKNTLENILRPVRTIGLAAALAASGATATGCATTGTRYAFSNYDVDGDGHMDLISDDFAQDPSGHLIYNFRLRRGGSGDAHDPRLFLSEVSGSVMLPAASSRTVSVTYFQDINGDGVPEMLVVERTGDRFNLYTRQFTYTDPVAGTQTSDEGQHQHAEGARAALVGPRQSRYIRADQPIYLIRDHPVRSASHVVTF